MRGNDGMPAGLEGVVTQLRHARPVRCLHMHDHGSLVFDGGSFGKHAASGRRLAEPQPPSATAQILLDPGASRGIGGPVGDPRRRIAWLEPDIVHQPARGRRTLGTRGGRGVRRGHATRTLDGAAQLDGIGGIRRLRRRVAGKQHGRQEGPRARAHPNRTGPLERGRCNGRFARHRRR